MVILFLDWIFLVVMVNIRKDHTICFGFNTTVCFLFIIFDFHFLDFSALFFLGTLEISIYIDFRKNFNADFGNVIRFRNLQKCFLASVGNKLFEYQPISEVYSTTYITIHKIDFCSRQKYPET